MNHACEVKCKPTSRRHDVSLVSDVLYVLGLLPMSQHCRRRGFSSLGFRATPRTDQQHLLRIHLHTRPAYPSSGRSLTILRWTLEMMPNVTSTLKELSSIREGFGILRPTAPSGLHSTMAKDRFWVVFGSASKTIKMLLISRYDERRVRASESLTQL